MLIRNKKTKEVIDIEGADASMGRIELWDRTNSQTLAFASIAELANNWEDADEER